MLQKLMQAKDILHSISDKEQEVEENDIPYIKSLLQDEILLKSLELNKNLNTLSDQYARKRRDSRS